MAHECLKGRWRVALAEEHYCRFVEPIRSSESGLPLVGLLNLNVVVPPPDIQFGKIPGMLESVNEVGDMRKRGSILDCMRIDVVVVLAGTESFILLQDKKEMGCLRRLGREDLSFLEILIDEHLKSFYLLWVE